MSEVALKPPVAPKPPMARVRSLLKPRPPSARITQADINFIAEKVAMRLTESEACRLIGVNPEQWYVYKARHKALLTPYFEATRAKQLIGHLDVIESAQKKDWRAADRLLSIKAPDRFGKEQGNALPATHSAIDGIILNALERVYGQPLTTSETKVVVDDLEASVVATTSVVDETKLLVDSREGAVPTLPAPPCQSQYWSDY